MATWPDALLSGAGELGSARALAADLAGKRDSAAPARRSARAPFYEAVDAWTTASTQLNEAVVRPPEIAEQERRRDEAATARDEALGHGRAATAELARLRRIRSTRRHLEALDDAAAWLAANPDAPALPAEAGAALAAAKQARDEAARTVRDAAEQMARLTADLQSVSLDGAVHEAAAMIDQLAAAAAVAAQSRADIPKREGELAAARRAIASLLRELASPADPADARGELRAVADIETARSLIRQAADLGAKRLAAQSKLAQHEEQLAEAESDLAALPAATTTDALRAAFEEVTAEGDPARLARDAEAAVERARAERAAALARMPGAVRDPAALAGLGVPSDASWTRLDAALTAATTAAEAADARCLTMQADLDAAERRLADLTGARPLPDEAAVAGARAHRDHGWSLIFARLTGAGAAEAEAAYVPGLALPLAFERAMAEADAVADRRAEEAERLGQAAILRAAIVRAEEAVKAATEAAKRLADARRGARAAWAEATSGIGLPGEAAPAEIRAFIAARQAALEADAAVTVAACAAASLRDRHAGWSARLAGALGEEPGALPTLIATARLRLRDADAVVASWTALEKTVAAARRAVERAAPASKAAEQAMQAWTGRWNAMLVTLRRPVGEAPAVTAEVLDRLVALPAKLDAADTAEGRLMEMRQQLGKFERDALALADQLGDPGGDAVLVAARLSERLTAARAAHTKRETLTQQTAVVAARHRDAVAALESADRSIGAAIAAVKAGTVEEAERLLGLAAQRSSQELAEAEALRLLREDGDGLPLAALRADVVSTPADAVADAMERARLGADAANDAVQRAAATIATAEAAISQLATGRDAAGARGGATGGGGPVVARARGCAGAALGGHHARTRVDRGGDEQCHQPAPAADRRDLRVADRRRLHQRLPGRGGRREPRTWPVTGAYAWRGRLPYRPAVGGHPRPALPGSAPGRDRGSCARVDRPAVHCGRRAADLRRHTRPGCDGGAGGVEPACAGDRVDPPSASACRGARAAGA